MKYIDLEKLAQDGKLFVHKTQMEGIKRYREFPILREILEEEYNLIHDKKDCFVKLDRKYGLNYFEVMGYETKYYPIVYYNAQTEDMGNTYWKITKRDYAKLVKKGAVDKSNTR